MCWHQPVGIVRVLSRRAHIVFEHATLAGGIESLTETVGQTTFPVFQCNRGFSAQSNSAGFQLQLPERFMKMVRKSRLMDRLGAEVSAEG
jgi:hypothetical protein